MSDQDLSQFKAQEAATQERAYVICENDLALRVLASWSVDVMCSPKSGHQTKADTWEGLWANYAIDYAKLAAMTGLEVKTIQQKVEQLRLLRLIYPDGTIHRWARDVIRRKLAAKLGIKPKKPEPTPEAEPKPAPPRAAPPEPDATPPTKTHKRASRPRPN